MTKHSILITGAASGIGAGIAQQLAGSGHRVLLGDLDPDRVQAVAAGINQEGGDAEAFRLDVTDDDNVAAAGEQLAAADVVVNNAGLQHVADLPSFPMDRWDLLIQVMLTGAARVTRAALPAMRERGYGRIVNIGSIHSLVASPFKSAYISAKHGLLGLSKTVALETADTDITINTICPTYVKTPLVEQQIAAQARSHGISEDRVVDEIMLKPMPKGVFIGFDELAGIVEFLLSPPARNITGQTITVDGGWTAQ